MFTERERERERNEMFAEIESNQKKVKRQKDKNLNSFPIAHQTRQRRPIAATLCITKHLQRESKTAVYCQELIYEFLLIELITDLLFLHWR